MKSIENKGGKQSIIEGGNARLLAFQLYFKKNEVKGINEGKNGVLLRPGFF